jgi:hypothetical protein
MPEVKNFIYESVLKNEYKGLSVNFIPGATPELVIFKREAGKEAEEVSREAIDNLTEEQLHEFVQARGFKRIPPEEREQPPGPGNDDSEVEGVTLTAPEGDEFEYYGTEEEHQGHEEDHAEL